MSNRDTFQSSVNSAGKTKVATLSANETVKQTTIDAKLTVVGYTLQGGNYANLATAVKTANQAKWDADYAAEQAKQATHAAARDTLRNGGGDTMSF